MPPLPPARLIDSLPEILPKLLRLASLGATQIDEDLKANIVRSHGLSRRADAVPVTALAEEWEAIKQACTQVLMRDGFMSAGAEEAKRRIDVLVDDAIGYTLRGYYQEELDTLRGRGLERRDSPVEDRRRLEREGERGGRRERPGGA